MAMYSKDEVEKLDENLDRIVEYLTEMGKSVRESIDIQFGDYKYESYEYTMEFGPYGSCVRCGRIAIALNEGDVVCSCYIKDRSDRGDIIAKMCRDWDKIKQQVIKHVDAQKKLTNAINHFEL